MADDTSSRRTLEPVVMAPLHKSPSQHFMGLTHAELMTQVLTMAPARHDVKTSVSKTTKEIRQSEQIHSSYIYLKCLISALNTSGVEEQLTVQLER